jgi:hypothetical protein
VRQYFDTIVADYVIKAQEWQALASRRQLLAFLDSDPRAAPNGIQRNSHRSRIELRIETPFSPSKSSSGELRKEFVGGWCTFWIRPWTSGNMAGADTRETWLQRREIATAKWNRFKYQSERTPDQDEWMASRGAVLNPTPRGAPQNYVDGIDGEVEIIDLRGTHSMAKASGQVLVSRRSCNIQR